MLLINSASYVLNELQNEIGKLPPVFLPVGNKKFLTFQVSAIRKLLHNEKHIYVSLPLSYELNNFEKKLLEEVDVTPIFVKDDISLGLSLVFVLNEIGIYHEPLYLLHGDTLIDDMFMDLDAVAIADSHYDYKYENKCSINSKLSKDFWCGYFTFSSVKLLLKCLAMTQSDFQKSVLMYNESIKLYFQKVEQWHDCGHINSYFKTRCIITTQRAFNSLLIEDGIVTKSSFQKKKMNAEASWFSSIPNHLKKYSPQLISQGEDDKKGFYQIEFLSCLPLNELYVHGKNSVRYWLRIFELIFNYLKDLKSSFNQDESVIERIQQSNAELFNDKTISRLKDYSTQSKLDLNTRYKYNYTELPSILDIAKNCINQTLKLPIIKTVLHGDLCFRNVLYDSRSDNIKVLDPRGLDVKGEVFIYGNQIYDLAKLCHSVIGMYDFIIAENFNLSYDENMGYFLDFDIDERITEIQEAFMNLSIDGLSMTFIIPPTILLFLSMLPLHSDKPNRQKAMLINALRLYQKYSNLFN